MKLLRAEIKGQGAFVALFGMDRVKKVTSAPPGPEYLFGFPYNEKYYDETVALLKRIPFLKGISVRDREFELYLIESENCVSIPTCDHYVLAFDSSKPYTKTRVL